MKETVGFIGLGIMGRPMAKNLIKAGYAVTAYDRNKDKVADVASAGGTAAASVAQAAAQDVVITMLQNSPNVREVALGAGGIAGAAKPGTLFIDMSSIDPLVSQEISAALQPRGITMLDAPVSGGEPKAIDGTLSIMVGGPEDAFARAKEILLAMGSSAVWTGPIGSGNVTKLANQIIVAVNIAAVSEALELAAKAGVDPEKVYQAIRGGLAGSTVLDAKAPMMLKRNFKPGFRMELHIKDLNNAVDTARGVGAPLPMAAQALEMMKTLAQGGMGAQDHSGLVQYYEMLGGAPVGKE